MNEKKDYIPKVNLNNILSIHFIYKSSRSVRLRYNINTHCITVFVTCYLYFAFTNPLFTVGAIAGLLRSYNNRKVKKYILLLDSIGLITLVGQNKYTLTDTGLSVIAEISNNANDLIYSFCNKYGIEL